MRKWRSGTRKLCRSGLTDQKLNATQNSLGRACWRIRQHDYYGQVSECTKFALFDSSQNIPAQEDISVDGILDEQIKTRKSIVRILVIESIANY